MEQKIYFLGIGGIGMSALARFFLQRGAQVYGYDLTPSPITDQLQKEGAHIHFTEDISQIPFPIDFVVYTPAVPKNHLEYQYFVSKKTPIFKRSEVLGKLSQGHPTIAVAGTHGKTTTTAMLTQMLNPYRKLLAFIGGVSKNFDSNFILHKDFDTVVVEADEFDRSFLTLFPTLAIITSMDADHLDIYGNQEHLIESFQLFTNQIDKNGKLLIHEKVADQIRHAHKLTYGTSSHCDFQVFNIHQEPAQAHFSLRSSERTLSDISIGVSGMHNIQNAAATCAVGMLMQLTDEQIKVPMAEFCGVKRRFDYQIHRDDLVYIDDYAHHPEEIRAIITAVRNIYSDKKLTVIFQPHLYSRTRDFGGQFAEVLALADEILLLDIYPAREEPIAGITSQWLLEKIPHTQKKLLKKEELIPYLKSSKRDIILTVGAGDIDRLVPQIRSAFENKER
ncbi:MAG: UDP-N-acetylmuramate--L-alanine ligase [Bacteroidales bacterium]|nr:UDP-N-acetylmuramate--L-alanine ligase [Bacteroidales bacterium]